MGPEVLADVSGAFFQGRPRCWSKMTRLTSRLLRSAASSRTGPDGRDDADLVVVGPEPLPLADLVGDHEVGPLRRHLFPGVGDDVVRLRGEADQDLARFFFRPSRARMSGGLLDGQRVAGDIVFRGLRRPDLLEPEVGDGGGHEDDIRLRGRPPGTAFSISAAVVDHLHLRAGRRNERRRPGDEDDVARRGRALPRASS